MRIEQLYKKLGREEVDYPSIISALSAYASPRDKITHWLRSGELVRIKKGLYVFSQDVSNAPPSIELLANLIYGPSAISLQYALSFYGLIPERTVTVTSITPKRNKSFDTPVGDFTYRYIAPKKFHVDVDLVGIGQQRTVRMASPEKALCDHIHLNDNHTQFYDLRSVELYLLQDLRIEESDLKNLCLNRLNAIHDAYHDKRLAWLINWMKHLKQDRKK